MKKDISREHILAIKNMVCHRCVLSVENILKQLHISFHRVEVGEVYLSEKLKEKDLTEFQHALHNIGLELIDSRKGELIEKIKKLVIRKAHNEVTDKERKMKLSVFLAGELNHEYSYLSNLFSDVEGRTIEHYFISQRIEKARELIVYGQMNLTEIAMMLDYSSVAHLSAQFKKVTGLTPTHFKEVGNSKRKTLDTV